MKFIEKNASYHRLKNPNAVNADRDLLKEKNPQAKVLQRKFFDVARQSNEILYALLDVASEEEIIKNRVKNRVKDVKKKIPLKVIKAKSGKSPAKRKTAPKKKPGGIKITNAGKVKSDDSVKDPAGDVKEGSGAGEKKSTEKNPNTRA